MLQQKCTLSIDQGCWITKRKSGVKGVPIVTCNGVLRRSLNSTVLNKLKVINYPFEIPPDTQHDLRSETILFGDDLYRRLGGGLDSHILHVCVTIKYPPLLIAGNNSTMPETTTIRRIFE